MQCYYVESLPASGFIFRTDPQGLYNVADLVERGHVLPGSAGSWFNVSRLDDQDVVVEKILKRCLIRKYGSKRKGMG